MIIIKKLKLPALPKRSLKQQFFALYGLYGGKVENKNSIGFWNTMKSSVNKLWMRNVE